MLNLQNLSSLGDLINEVAETGLPDWFARTKLIDCICSFVLLEPRIAQVRHFVALGSLVLVAIFVEFFLVLMLVHVSLLVRP